MYSHVPGESKLSNSVLSHFCSSILKFSSGILFRIKSSTQWSILKISLCSGNHNGIFHKSSGLCMALSGSLRKCIGAVFIRLNKHSTETQYFYLANSHLERNIWLVFSGAMATFVHIVTPLKSQEQSLKGQLSQK